MERLGARIVVIGGGTGSFTLLGGLKHYARHITALVNMADDGGSTGALRDELGVLPPGDVRQCLVALSDSPKVRDLFSYRFEEGTLKGHSFGNLFLTALEKLTGSFAEAVETASEVLDITGRVLPVTLGDVRLMMRGKDGTLLQGEHMIDVAEFSHLQLRPELWLEPETSPNPSALEAIESADIVVIAPGSLYGSLAPALIVPGLGDALADSKAKKVYVCNLMTMPGQTDGFAVHDFADEIERLAGRSILDYVIYNQAEPSQDLKERYMREGEELVSIDEKILRTAHYKAIPADLIASEAWGGVVAADQLSHQRTLIRHDSNKIARQIMKIYFS